VKRSPYFILAVLAALASVQPKASFAQDTQEAPSAGVRKVVNKVVPVYPQTARTMNLRGTVKLEVLVQASGSAKFIQVKGGNPLLVQSAQSAVHAWKWEKADHETTEQLEFHFNP
jgi:outer membrane biosynthesis protein TonB